MSISTHSEESRLPHELERQIFEIAAHSRPTTIPSLMLVACRVKTWLEPMLYRVVSLTDGRPMDGFPHVTSEILLRAVNHKPPGFLGASTRHLYLWTAHKSEMAVILPACTGVTNLFVMTTGLDLFSVGDMKDLQRLAISIRDLFSQHRLDFTHRLFRNITHLEIFDESRHRLESNLPVAWAGLTLIPNLTHLSFWGRILLPIAARTVLPECPRLQYLVFLAPETAAFSRAAAACEALAVDPRFVAIVLKNFERDWLRGARLGRDYWTHAEEFVAAKRMGKVPSSEFQITVGDFDEVKKQ
ncbi:hypothetical protein DFH09DRAFT_1043296 [Mycena vulgaris]|nr:hypothetical protein DFH09DRAFT_1043296 [Mycena vulgaris]